MPRNPSQNPLGPPTVDGTEITVDQWLNSPTRVSRAMADMVVTAEDFFLDRVFSTLSNVQGGSVLYDPVLANSLYSDRAVQEIEPGMEYPILTSSRGEPKVARVKKFGGQIYITDEARKRNNSVVWDRETRKLSNTLVLQLNSIGMAVLDAAIADTDRETGGRRTAAGQAWVSALRVRASDATIAGLPTQDFAAIRRKAYEERQGIVFDTVIVNPQEDETLELLYGDRPNGLAGVLARFGITTKVVSSYQRAGQAKFVASRQVGGYGAEEPISTEIWRTQGRDRTDLKIRALPVVWADNRWAVWELTGLAS